MQYKDMKKQRAALGVLLSLCIIASPLMAGGISAPPALSQPVADSLYVNETGDTGMTGTHDYTIAVLLAADAVASQSVVNLQTGNGLYPRLAVANTFTKANIFNGDVTFGDAVTDGVNCPAGNWLWGNATTHTFSGALVLDALTKGAECRGEWTFANDLFVYGSMQFGLGAGDDILFYADTWTVLNDTTVNLQDTFRISGAGQQALITVDLWSITGNLFNAGNFTTTGNSIIGNEATDTLDGKGIWDLTGLASLAIVDPTGATHAVSRQFGDGRYIQTRSPIVVMFAGSTDPHFDTNNATYTTAGTFIFGGTTALGTPSAIKAIGHIDPNATSWDFRVIDITNATTIVEKTGNTGTVSEIANAGALSNLPAGEAMFEVQLKRAGGVAVDEAHLDSLTVEF